ncbi:MAG: urease accessory protein UreE [Sinimarinibacterium flocculans]|uniref:urease accessory protein UreE n=1 Tax=Sinimarinibacterium flocculans TaxID=985250 RepID=UPI003C33C614
MLRLTSVADARDVRCAPRELVLSFTERSRSRLRSVLDDGTDVGVLLPRGTVLRGGDLLRAETGEVVRVRTAIEPLYRVTAREDDADPRFSLLRGAYHLGNRHVPLMLAPQALHLEQDPVLREMLLRLGLIVAECMAAFEPEAGAYGGGHRHDHDVQGGSLGEQLSREAHARRAVDLSTLQFHR